MSLLAWVSSLEVLMSKLKMAVCFAMALCYIAKFIFFRYFFVEWGVWGHESMMFAETVNAVRSVIRHRQLLSEFVVRDIKGRFAGSFAGMLWTILTPMATILSYGFVFSVVLRVTVTVDETGTDRFILFFLSGFFPWILFADSLTRSVGAVVAQSHLVTKVVFPVELIPTSTTLSVFILNTTGFLIFLVWLAGCGFLHWTWLFIPVVMGALLLFSLALSFFLSALCVFIRDTAECLNIFMMLWFFSTPVIYPASLVPDAMVPWLSVNPMTLFTECMRDILLKHQVDGILILALWGIAIMALVPCIWVFMRSKPAFGDVL